MTVVEFLLLIVAGFGAGLVGFVTGLASIVSYPALLGIGLDPVAANVTNTVALVAVGLGALASSSGEIAKGGKPIAWMAGYSALGGLTGALILLLAPEGSFETVVPYLVVFASVALLLQPRIRILAGENEFPTIYPIGLFLVSIYGGYFGAGAGVIFLALTMICTSEKIWRASILKSFMLGVSNLVAAIVFAILGNVNWLAALAMALGAFVGGAMGPPVVKVLPANLLRVTVAICGVGLAVWLLVK